MKRPGRSTDQALLRTAVNKKMQTFAHKRLVKDLQQIQNQTIPTVGVIARPLDTDLFTWHGNIRGPQGTLYQGGIFHIQLKFPQSYPNHPPTVTLFTTVPHPNVFQNYICLDMIQPTQAVRKEQGAGWTSAYSAQSVLTQLQSFLFEQNLNDNKETYQMQVKKAVKNANQYKCRTCKHGGKLSCWPSFALKQPKIQEFATLQSQNDLIKKQLICFHTKLSYKQNQLGLGLNISKIPRTGNIRQGQTYFDYISVKAFLKQSMKLSSHNQRITHWLPVYFGKQDNPQKFLFFLQGALSMIMTNSTINFKPAFIIQVFSKLIITIIFHIMDEKKHASIRAIRILTHLHSMFLFQLKNYPQLKKSLKEQIDKFLLNEQNRCKDAISNLGSILAKVAVLDDFKFTDVNQTYFSEQLDRQVLWILKAVPELLNQTMVQQADKLRSAMVFKSQMTSFHMFCFYKVFIGIICEKRKNRQQMLNEYQENLCKLTNEEQNQFQRLVLQIPKKVTSFSQFFKFVGLKQRNEQQILQLLKQAIKNSQRKKYHGQFQIMYELPGTNQQLKKITQKLPSYDKYIKVKVETQKQGDKQSHKFIIKQQKNTQQNWKQMCFERWSWILQVITYDPHVTSNNISSLASKYGKQGISKPEDRLTRIINQKYLNSKIDYKEPAVPNPEISWKQVFLRLDLEDFLAHIDMNPDFPVFYQKLQVCKYAKVNTIMILIFQVNNLKSGYHYLTSLLSKMNTLKFIEFSGLPQMNNQLSQKCAKSIKKGFNNFKKQNGKLQMLSFHNLSVNIDISDSLFDYLSTAQTLISLRFCQTNFFNYGNTIKVLAKHLIDLKNIEQLVLNNCQLDQNKCKIIADSLMRMKNLKIFQIHYNHQLGQGLASIIYNLAFSPYLRKLEISNCRLQNSPDILETIVSLQKLFKINSSIEIIKIKNMPTFNPQINKQFLVALGQCKSLRVLDLQNSGLLIAKVTQMGQAIAFNAKKKGSLEYLNLTGTLTGPNILAQLYTSMNISEYDQQNLYGDPNKLSKMIASNYKKVYFNNLKSLQLNNNYSMNPTFNITHYNKLVEKKDPQIVKLFAQSINLQSIHMKSTNLQKSFADILVLSLDPRRTNFVSQIKVLNLAKNTLGKDGVKSLAEVLPYNNILEVLDLSKNFLGVSGAYELAVALKNNTSLKYLNLFNNKISFDGTKAIAENVVANSPSLQFLQLGHNRIRDKGLKIIVDAIISNKKSTLKILCFRFNFVTNSAAEYLLNQITIKNNKIQQIFMKNNSLDDKGIDSLYEIKQKSKSKLSVDILQKIKYLEQDRSDRTIWISPIGMNLQNLKKFFEITYKCGIVLDMRLRKGKKYPNKQKQNYFIFVQFADATSVTRALHLASNKLTCIDGVNFRIYKAGTGTFLYTKKTAKQNKLEIAKRALPIVPYATAVKAALQSRGGVAVRGRGGRVPRGPARRAPEQKVQLMDF